MKGISKKLFAIILVPVMLLCMTAMPVSAAGSKSLNAPSNVVIQNSGTGFYITWNKAAGAVKYRVFYKTKESAWMQKDSYSNAVSLSGLLYGKLYYIQVQSIGSNNENGGFSKVASMTHVRTTKLVSTAYDLNGTATVGWNAAAGANGYAVAKKRSTDKNYTYYYTAKTSFTDTNIESGAKYFYQIRPYFTNGKSAAYAPWSNTKSLTALRTPAVTSVGYADECLNIEWDAVNGANGYKVAFKRDIDTAWNFRTTALFSYSVPDPTQGATYYVQICALNGNNAGPYSEVGSFKIGQKATADEIEPPAEPSEENTDLPEPAKLQLNTSELKLGVNEQYTLKIQTNADIQELCTFSSSDTSVAVVDNTGKIIPQKAGTATVTCSYNDLSAACKVTVCPQAAKLTLNAADVTIGVGEQFDLNSFVNSGAAAFYRVYSTSNSAVATVTSSGGLVTAIGKGTATITCKLNNGVKAVCTVRVYPYAKSLSLNATSITLEVGQTFDFNSFVPSGYAARYRDFYSQNTSVVSIAKSGGLAKGLKIGTTKIYCQIRNNVRAYATVTVKKPFRSVMVKHLQSQVGNSNASYVKYVNSKTNIRVTTSFDWCAEFAWCMIDQFAAKVKMKDPVKPCVHVSEIAMQAKSKGALKSAYSSGYVPKPGDLFTTSTQKYPGSSGRLHIGFIESVETNAKGQVTKIHTIEGNYNWEYQSSTATRVSRNTWIPDKKYANYAILCEYIDIEKLFSY